MLTSYCWRFIESSLGTSSLLFYNIPISLRPSWIWCEKVYPSFIFCILNRNITPNITIVKICRWFQAGIWGLSRWNFTICLWSRYRIPFWILNTHGLFQATKLYVSAKILKMIAHILLQDCAVSWGVGTDRFNRYSKTLHCACVW